MKRFLIAFLILLAFSSFAFAQIAPIGAPPAPPPTMAAPLITASGDVTTGPVTPVTVTIVNRTVYTMNISVDGGALGEIPPNSKVVVTISGGIHRWMATNKAAAPVANGPTWGPIDLTGPCAWSLVP